jgi:hypothetical protein
MNRAALAAFVIGPPAIVACTLLRSLDGYSDQYGLVDASDAPADVGVAAGIDYLALDQHKPHGIVVNANYFYWTNEDDGTMSRCPILGCNGQPTVHDGQYGPTDMAMNNYDVYWVNSDASTVGWCDRQGCFANLMYPVGDASPVSIASGVDIGPYWTTTGGSIGACIGCGFVQPGQIVGGQDEPRGIAVASTASGAKPFWAARGAKAIMKCDSQSCAGDGGPTVFVSDQGAVDRVAVDATHVYWSNDALIRSCPLDGCVGPPLQIAEGQDHPRALALDDARVYWTNGDGTVRACPTSGCPPSGPTVIVDGQDDPQGLAVTTDYVYWVSRGRGWVARVKKR